MPAILTATVIRWRVEGDPPVVAYGDEGQVRLYTSDGSERAGSSEVMIIAQYILDSAKRAEKDRGDVVVELLQNARDGLLEVTDVDRREVRPPPVPPKRNGPGPKKDS